MNEESINRNKRKKKKKKNATQPLFLLLLLLLLLRVGRSVGWAEGSGIGARAMAWVGGAWEGE